MLVVDSGAAANMGSGDREQGQAPVNILSEAALLNLCKAKPLDNSALQLVEGVPEHVVAGPVGAAVLAAVRPRRHRGHAHTLSQPWGANKCDADDNKGSPISGSLSQVPWEIYYSKRVLSTVHSTFCCSVVRHWVLKVLYAARPISHETSRRGWP